MFSSYPKAVIGVAPNSTIAGSVVIARRAWTIPPSMSMYADADAAIIAALWRVVCPSKLIAPSMAVSAKIPICMTGSLIS